MSQIVDEDKTFSYKGGTIKSIKLVNFMCHESFELSFGPKVNFVIGPNGSGKSALLTAIVVALGGRATITCRAKKASDFVMYGKNYCRVTVVIHNYDKVMDRAQAFKPNDYGKSITVEKTIYKDDVSKLVMKNDKDRKVSERAHELHEMLDHFNILINNPICILNQEVSKTFLHSKRPEDKFDLFMKATNLEQIEEDYDIAKNEHQCWEETNARKSVTFKMLDREFNACQEKLAFLENRRKLNEVLDNLNKEYIWAIIRDTEKSTTAMFEEKRVFDKIIEEAKEQIEQRNAKIKENQEHIEMMRDKIQTVQETVDNNKKKLADIRLREESVRTKKNDFQVKIHHSKRTIEHHDKNKSDLEKSIAELKKNLQAQNALDLSNEQRKLEIEKLEREAKMEEARHKSTSSIREQLAGSMITTRTELSHAKMRFRQIKDKIGQATNAAMCLKNGQKDSIRKYGDSVLRLREEIDKAHSQGKFKHKPIGPLGYYLRLKSPDVAGPLENYLGRNAHAFACDNQQDMATLTGLCKKLSTMNRGFRTPVIINRPFVKRFDVRQNRASHPDYKTLLDYLDIAEDAAYNAIVDRTSLECVFYIPDYAEAESLMIDMDRVPKNTRCAFTKDVKGRIATMYPNTRERGYKSITHGHFNYALFTDNITEQIKELERELEKHNGDLRAVEFSVKEIEHNLNEQRKEHDSYQLELNNITKSQHQIEDKLHNLKTMVIEQPQELSALETQLEKTELESGREKVSLDSYKESLELVEAEMDEIIKEKAECMRVQRSLDEERQTVHKMIEGTKNSILKFEQEVKERQKTISNKDKEKEELNEKLERDLQKLAISNQKAVGSERPRKIREVAVIMDDRQAIEKQILLDQEENRDPEELMLSLRKRMQEIQDLRQIREDNMDNFSLATSSINDRKIGYAALKSNTVGAVGATFSAVMRTMKMNGRIQIYLEDKMENGEIVRKAKTLEMQIDTHYTPSQRVMNDTNNNSPQRSSRLSYSQPAMANRAKRARRDAGDSTYTAANEKENDLKMTDARSLSGGERSFSTVAFVLALWNHCSSPFKLMDEIDVFMDMVTRRASYNALITFAKVSEDSGQFIFFSPLELPKFDSTGNFVRVFEMPAIIRKQAITSQSQPDDS